MFLEYVGFFLAQKILKNKNDSYSKNVSEYVPRVSLGCLIKRVGLECYRCLTFLYFSTVLFYATS